MPSPVQLVGNLSGAIGSDFRRPLNQLVFVEFGGKLSRLNLTHTATVVTSGSATLLASYGFNLDTGIEDSTGAPLTGDIWWSPPAGMVRIGNAQMINLGVTDFASLTPDTIQSLPYSAATIPQANLSTNDVFAVHTNGGNFSKIQVIAAGLNLQIQWVTYKLDSPYAVLGTGYQEPEDVKVSADGMHVYVTERTGNLLKVPLAGPNRTPAMVLSSGMTAPQQLFLDESNNHAYVVEFAPAGHLWQINLTTGAKTAVLSGLQNAVGLVLGANLQFAYISEQTTGPDTGRVSRFQLSNGARQTIVKGLTAPFFLTWNDATQNLLLVPERDPANRITMIDVAGKNSQVVLDGVPFRPSSVTVPAPGQMLICSDKIIEEADLLAFQPAGPVLMGIGFIPFDKVITVAGPTQGLADTTVDPTYFYQVKNTPFGGALPLTLNYMRALNDGAAYYRVFVQNASQGFVLRDVSWTDEHWNGFEFVAVTTGPRNVGGQPGFFPTRAISDLFLWMNPSLGGFVQSTDLPDGLNTIWIEFVGATGNLIEWATPLTILVDNNRCTATLAPPTVNAAGADSTCGLLHYGTTDASPVSMPFTASHPNNFATFSFVLVKGVNQVTLPPLPIAGDPVTAALGLSPVVETVANLRGNCTIAAFAEEVHVFAAANNGWSRQSQYDADALIAYVLAP
ncbi:hypothetical protein M0D69_13640 [Caballeronia sp. SEWSISQ10-4 2]|uniref:YncE family protein n=1 Tax=Caballeronia sp. SEWSISQ10-4 2 TaxID=2937438 RepID=UPI002651175A|nr:hypothetical protein [Caballeronia sp. SEWSISQ10-4 2]MDN7179038.1 hypothetical protein [Caballeronia sp. SEWSISQ10-4 2]